MTFELVSYSALPPTVDDGFSITGKIADGIMQGFARVGEWMINGIVDGLVWVATKVAPIVTIISEGAIVLCVFIYVMTKDTKYSSALLKWIIIFFISLMIVGGVE